jgi:hypothetical protein
MKTLYTKTQLLHVFAAWGVSATVPAKGQKTVVSFPPPAALNLAVITWDTAKSSYGDRLYCVEMTRG